MFLRFLSRCCLCLSLLAAHTAVAHADPHEWHNLARDPGHQAMCSELSRWIPSPSVQPAPGSAHRILTYQQGVATWEEKIIAPNEPIPEVDMIKN